MNKALFLALAITAFLSHAQERRIEPREQGRRVALVIGNNDYPWKPLRNAVNDAQAVAKLLNAAYFV